MFIRTLTLALLLVTPAYAALNEAETAALLEKIATAKKDQRCLQVNYHEVKTQGLSTRPTENRGTFWLRLPNQFRREVKGGSGTISVSNGDEVWMYYPGYEKAELYKIGQQKMLDEGLKAFTSGLDLTQIAKNYAATAEPLGTGWRLTLKPLRSPQKKLIKQLILELNAAYEIIKSELSLEKDKTRFVTTYSNHRSAEIPESMFNFAPPEGTKIDKKFEEPAKQ